MSLRYFWKDNEVVVRSKDQMILDLLDCPCLDTNCPEAFYRYGKYMMPGGDDDEQCYEVWEAMPVSEFPPQFRASLMLLGAG